MEEIQAIIIGMNVPEARVSDLHWLSRNLGIKNSIHPKFHEVMKLIKIEINK